MSTKQRDVLSDNVWLLSINSPFLESTGEYIGGICAYINTKGKLVANATSAAGSEFYVADTIPNILNNISDEARRFIMGCLVDALTEDDKMYLRSLLSAPQI